MDLGTFYAIVAATCFTLVGLWWTVVERHPEWHTDPEARRLAGGVYLSFLLPALMSLLAQVDPSQPLIWRTAFLASALVGGWSAWSLMRMSGAADTGPFGRNRWLVLVLYGLVFLLAVAPQAAELLGMSPLQVGGVLLALLVASAHALTWELLLPRAAGRSSAAQ